MATQDPAGARNTFRYTPEQQMANLHRAVKQQGETIGKLIEQMQEYGVAAQRLERALATATLRTSIQNAFAAETAELATLRRDLVALFELMIHRGQYTREELNAALVPLPSVAVGDATGGER